MHSGTNYPRSMCGRITIGSQWGAQMFPVLAGKYTPRSSCIYYSPDCVGSCAASGRRLKRKTPVSAVLVPTSWLSQDPPSPHLLFSGWSFAEQGLEWGLGGPHGGCCLLLRRRVSLLIFHTSGERSPIWPFKRDASGDHFPLRFSEGRQSVNRHSLSSGNPVF